MAFQELNGASMTPHQINTYLARIGMRGIPVSQDPDYLSKLQYAHITQIPYENLDIMAGIPTSLNREVLFHKIIEQRRGGVCSELNTLYNWLLESLGFDVTSYSSRIIAQTRPLQSASHRIMLVQFAHGAYLTDVGFNYQHHRKPLLLAEGLIQDDGDCQYKLERDDFFGWIMWQNRPQSGWRKKLGFAELPQIDLDFVYPTFFAEAHPDSVINKATKVSLYLPDEEGMFYAIRAGQFLREMGGEIQVLEDITSPEQERRILKEVFHLSAG